MSTSWACNMRYSFRLLPIYTTVVVYCKVCNGIDGNRQSVEYSGVIYRNILGSRCARVRLDEANCACVCTVRDFRIDIGCRCVLYCKPWRAIIR